MKKDKNYYNQLDTIAKAFYNLSVREGPIEDLYKICSVGALGVSYFDPIDLDSDENKQMKELRKMLRDM